MARAAAAVLWRGCGPVPAAGRVSRGLRGVAFDAGRVAAGAELGPQSQRGAGAPSHRAQHTDVPSQPDYNDKGTYSSAPSFQQRL